ncbi:replication initiator protein [Peromfec virus RodF7_17]|uniref:Replication initiator protein n=1 Tax=Peromfec virus RodF7_17 TaxID=2929352 RepID=A0A976N2Z4_9VIRU|nr:replication initiator protein [Peromfec virus RodF7_17]
MQCLRPIVLKRVIDGKWRIDPVPCGKCINCLDRKRKFWFARLMIESRSTPLPPVMITLTYDDDHLPVSGDVSKKDVQDFLKRLRYYSQESFRYFIVSEYGPLRHRAHYHGILFDFPLDKATDDIIGKAWSNGFVSIGIAKDGGLSYCCKYVTFKSHSYGKAPNFMLASRRPAIGLSYLENADLVKWHKADPVNNSYITFFGKKLPMPRYLKEKIYNEEERKLISDKCSEESFKNRMLQNAKFKVRYCDWVEDRQADNEYIAQRSRDFDKSFKKSKDL